MEHKMYMYNSSYLANPSVVITTSLSLPLPLLLAHITSPFVFFGDQMNSVHIHSLKAAHAADPGTFFVYARQNTRIFSLIVPLIVVFF